MSLAVALPVLQLREIHPTVSLQAKPVRSIDPVGILAGGVWAEADCGITKPRKIRAHTPHVIKLNAFLVNGRFISIV